MGAYDFASYRVFTDLKKGLYGNVSTVVRIPSDTPETQLQQIAADLAQPATTFLWKEEDTWKVRWFAPDSEIKLCGHGAMAAVAYAMDFLQADNFEMHYSSGKISGGKHNQTSCFTDLKPIPTEHALEIPEYLPKALGIPVEAFYKTANKHLVVANSETEVRNMRPNFELLRSSDIFGYVVTAPGSEMDFVSRTLVPHVQQLEDHATGSSHAILMPYWSQVLNRSHLTAQQLSKRGGAFQGKLIGSSVRLIGQFQKINQGKLCSL
ncbi:PhzF family phenazine biosynthesis protein [Marinoscillum furvescens]|uniref:PhzF family phenazine biosynthesis protein n=1 Tax=Marinoscillum furvescens DSM 4134 TaxID=1122208 RepID=A0A3D9L7Q4_MARFU|nr:PhzF family phenazine biosynthesis protein [Marinoscillum furvescens]REE02112.1 PhzF family phenazine biosynthesis protein [Marinoscillum furvescens DSM 4134]